MPKTLALGYQQISSDLRDQIARGRLKPGAALPSESQLATHYKVSRMTVRQGLRVLEDEGLVQVIPSKGRIVAKPESRGAKPASKHGGRVAFVTGSSGSDFSHPYPAGIHNGLSEVFAEAGVDWELRLAAPGTDPCANLSPQFSAALVFGIYDARRLEALRQLGIPAVFLNQRPATGGDAVSTDNFAGGYLAAQQILAHGHTQIAYFHWEIDDPAFRDRFLGFRQCVEDHKLPPDALRVMLRPPWNVHDIRLREMLVDLLGTKNRPTALFACTDEWATRICAILETMNLRVPHDISVVGYDRYVPNPFPGQLELSTLEQPGRDVGVCGARKVLARLNDATLPQSVELIAPTWIEGKTLIAPPATLPSGVVGFGGA